MKKNKKLKCKQNHVTCKKSQKQLSTETSEEKLRSKSKYSLKLKALTTLKKSKDKPTSKPEPFVLKKQISSGGFPFTIKKTQSFGILPFVSKQKENLITTRTRISPSHSQKTKKKLKNH